MENDEPEDILEALQTRRQQRLAEVTILKQNFHTEVFTVNFGTTKAFFLFLNQISVSSL